MNMIGGYIDGSVSGQVTYLTYQVGKKSGIEYVAL